MKQTVEEAARKYADENCWIPEELHDSEIPDYIGHFAKHFTAGAEWQAKQSPWISVKERLPEPLEEVLIYDKNSIRHYVTGWLRKDKGYNNSMWALSNGWVENKDITHWMPIPKFN